MRKYAVLILMLSMTIPVWAATYHVASTGNDNNAGTDPAAPWLTNTPTRAKRPISHIEVFFDVTTASRSCSSKARSTGVSPASSASSAALRPCSPHFIAFVLVCHEHLRGSHVQGGLRLIEDLYSSILSAVQ